VLQCIAVCCSVLHCEVIEIATCISSELAAQIEMPLDPSGQIPTHVYVRYISLIQIHIYRFVSACAHAHLICKYTQIGSNTYVYEHEYVWTRKYTDRINIPKYIYIHICIYKYIYMHNYIYVYIFKYMYNI